MKEIIQHTDNEGLDIVTANMNLISASLAVMLEQKRPQQTRFKKAFGQAGMVMISVSLTMPRISISPPSMPWGNTRCLRLISGGRVR